ncbi:hypothetical protein TNCT_657391 [Trichonephila clavata]|uniref:Uncharacterized protein n=1 Tax=Trichonephila clavata TaxID=2740835 RepID=A0A8X6KGA9_TRICU|nr:hypothetical protein TNCT_657391 [Trichonephila clavata]
MTEDHNFKKLCPQWVPRLLTAEFASSLRFLIRYEEEGDDLLSRIVTGDEKLGYPISHRNQSNNRWNGDTHPLPSI